ERTLGAVHEHQHVGIFFARRTPVPTPRTVRIDIAKPARAVRIGHPASEFERELLKHAGRDAELAEPLAGKCYLQCARRLAVGYGGCDIVDVVLDPRASLFGIRDLQQIKARLAQMSVPEPDQPLDIAKIDVGELHRSLTDRAARRGFWPCA